MNGKERGWRTITGFIIIALGGVLLALSMTPIAPVDKEVAIGFISVGLGLAGIGSRIAQGKQIQATAAQSILLESIGRVLTTSPKVRTAGDDSGGKR